MASITLTRKCAATMPRIGSSHFTAARSSSGIVGLRMYFTTSHIYRLLGKTGILQSWRPIRDAIKLQGRAFNTTCMRPSKRLQRSWDVDGVVSKDTLVYSYKNDRYYRLITIFGITQLFFWGNLALFSYSGLSDFDEASIQEKLDGKSFWGQVLENQVKHRYRIAVFCMTIGYAVLFFTWMYPQRSVSKLTLLMGGKNLRVTTYTHFGKTRNFEVPLSIITSKQSRTVDQPTMSFKVKGHWFYYILDKRNGVFHEPNLFDNVINLKRTV